MYQYSKRKSDERHPVKIRITAFREARYYSLKFEAANLFLSLAEWEAVNGAQKVRGKNKEIRETILAVTHKASEAIKKATNNDMPFTWSAFESEFVYQESKKTFYDLADQYLNDLRKQDRVGTVSSYGCAITALKKFQPSLRPEQISVQFLKDFEAYLRANKVEEIKTKTGLRSITRAGCSDTTIGIYARSIRTILNYAIGKNPDLARYYPFSRQPSERGKYQIPEATGSHKGEALSESDFLKFVSVSLEPHTPEWRAKLYWLFSYFAVGMNFADLARLQYTQPGSDKPGLDLENEVLTFVREKTKRTNRQKKVVEIALNESALQIIRALNRESENVRRFSFYMFPILAPGLSPEQEKKRIAQWIKNTNKALKKICKENGLPELTTYWSRHSAASHLKFSDVPVEMISQLLGHGDVKTTAAYLARFDRNKVKAVTDKLAVKVNF